MKYSLSPRWFFSILFFVLSVYGVVAQDACIALIQSAIETNDACDAISPSEICYGRGPITAEAYPEITDFAFDESGAISPASSIQTLHLLGTDESSGQLATAVVGFQNGSRITVIGNITLQNTALTAAEQTAVSTDIAVNSSQNVNVRAFPSADAAVLSTLAPGTYIQATGRSIDNEWIRIVLAAQNENPIIGWLFARTVRLTEASTLDNLAELPMIDVSQPEFGALQQFNIQLGAGSSDCTDPMGGILIQAASRTVPAELMVNGVQIQVSGTAFIYVSAEGEVRLVVADGIARVQIGDEKQTAGGVSEIILPSLSVANGGIAATEEPAAGTDETATATEEAPAATEEAPISEPVLKDIVVVNPAIVSIFASLVPAEVLIPLTQEEVDNLNYFQSLFNSIASLGDCGNVFSLMLLTSDPNELVSYIVEDLGYILPVPEPGTENPNVFVFNPANFPNLVLPQDTDGDGVSNNQDSCPTVAGTAANSGCPALVPLDQTDGDSDGVADEADECPATPGPASNDGCPLQS